MTKLEILKARATSAFSCVSFAFKRDLPTDSSTSMPPLPNEESMREVRELLKSQSDLLQSGAPKDISFVLEHAFEALKACSDKLGAELRKIAVIEIEKGLVGMDSRVELGLRNRISEDAYDQLLGYNRELRALHNALKEDNMRAAAAHLNNVVSHVLDIGEPKVFFPRPSLKPEQIS